MMYMCILCTEWLTLKNVMKTLRSGRQDLAMADGDPLPALEDFLLDDGE